MSEINSVVQIIVSQNGAKAFNAMVAGTGWFAELLPEGAMLTNAHVVHNAKSVFIRMPCAHSVDIPVYVQGLSTDLDLAIIRLDTPELDMVKNLLLEKYGTNAIPTLQLADSDKVHPSRYDTLKAPRVYARGYPLGTEYQQVTDGRISGIKHAREQEYIVTTATINPGNSGGPAVNEEGHVVGINSMKMNGAEGINMIIPSNRIKRMIPYLLDNHNNEEELEHVMEAARMMHGVPSAEQISSMRDMIPEVDFKEVVSTWNKNNLGGFKKVNGIVSPVTIKDWFKKHVHKKAGGHKLFYDVVSFIHNDEIEKVQSMRREGFSNYLCEECSTTKACKTLAPSIVPPRSLHMPRLGFRYSNSSGEKTMRYYNAEQDMQGVIVSDVIPGGMMDRAGISKYDFIYKVETERGDFEIDNYGECWVTELSVSLTLNDIIHRTPFGEDIVLHVMKKGGDLHEITMAYTYLQDKYKPSIRFMDSMHDLNYQNEVANVGGVLLKTLRMEDVMEHQIGKYMDPHLQNEFKVVVSDIDTKSPAYMSRNMRPGDVLAKINDEPVAKSWKGFVQQLTGLKSVALEVENGSITII